MKKIVPFATILILAFASTGCSLLPFKREPGEGSIPGTGRVDLFDSKAVKEKMYSQYQDWKGTKYKLGGLSKQGIDCSGLVYITYREKLDIELPRTTELQSRVGNEIQRSELRAGDLVFFKTSPKVRHVGMYIEEDTFLHASTKKGVKISRLSNYYWRKKYWHSRRVGD